MSHKFSIIRIWLVMVIASISLISTPVLAQSSTTVWAEPATQTAQVSAQVTTSIKVENVTSLTAFEWHGTFNPAVLEVVQISNGGFVLADFTAQSTFDNTAGTIDYAVAQLNRAPAQGSGILLNIVFRAKTNGSSSIALRATQAVPSGLLLSDENGISIQAAWVGGTITVGNSPIPTWTATQTPITPGPTTSTPTVTTPAPTSTPTLTPTTPPGARIHIVRPGETLFCIGRAYKVWPFAIAEANHIWWPYTIYPNQKLTIPTTVWSPIPVGPTCPAQFSPSVPPAATATVTATSIGGDTIRCRTTYYVHRDDTLYNIAVRYGTNYTELARVNQIANARLIYIGQRLCIP